MSVDPNKPTSLSIALASNGFVTKGEDMFLSVEQVLDSGKTFSGYDLYIFEGVEPPEGEDFPTDGAVWLFNPAKIPDVVSGVEILYDDEQSG